MKNWEKELENQCFDWEIEGIYEDVKDFIRNLLEDERMKEIYQGADTCEFLINAALKKERQRIIEKVEILKKKKIRENDKVDKLINLTTRNYNQAIDEVIKIIKDEKEKSSLQYLNEKYDEEQKE